MTGDIILQGSTHPEYILLHTSPSGSYRCGHVIEFLAFILPVAQTAEDSCMVILDRFAPHMSEEVEHLVAEYGHLYDVFGGGGEGERCRVKWAIPTGTARRGRSPQARRRRLIQAPIYENN